MRRSVTAALVCAALFGPVSAASAAAGQPHASSNAAPAARLEANKKVVRAFCELAFNQKKPAEAARLYLGRQYKQHSPMAPDGFEGFIGMMTGFSKANPQMHMDIKRVIADGDLVVVHSHFTMNPADRGSAVADIFRVENGKIVEHWDVMQPVPEKAANPNTMF